MTIKVIIFDCDGVILDSNIAYEKVFEKLLKKYRIHETKKEIYAHQHSFDSYIDMVDSLKRRNSCFEEDEEEFVLTEEDTNRLLKYCVSRAIHQDRAYALGETRYMPDGLSYFNMPNRGFIELKAEEIYPKLKEIAKINPLVSEQSAYNIDDVVQDALMMMEGVLK